MFRSSYISDMSMWFVDWYSITAHENWSKSMYKLQVEQRRGSAAQQHETQRQDSSVAGHRVTGEAC